MGEAGQCLERSSIKTRSAPEENMETPEKRDTFLSVPVRSRDGRRAQPLHPISAHGRQTARDEPQRRYRSAAPGARVTVINSPHCGPANCTSENRRAPDDGSRRELEFDTKVVLLARKTRCEERRLMNRWPNGGERPGGTGLVVRREPPFHSVKHGSRGARLYSCASAIFHARSLYIIAADTSLLPLLFVFCFVVLFLRKLFVSS